MKIDDIARVAHEANRAYCVTLGDLSQLPWDGAPDWQRASAIEGVKGVMEYGVDPRRQHNQWLAKKEADGWKYGTVKDAEAKTHPCLVPYDELPYDQQFKDALFGAVVQALLPNLK